MSGDIAYTGALSDEKAEAVEALVALGYSKKDALNAVSNVEAPDGTKVEQILKIALKSISRL